MSYDQQLADALRENTRLRWFEERYELKCKVIAKQDDEIEQLRAALKPFAKMYAKPGSDLDKKIMAARRALENAG